MTILLLIVIIIGATALYIFRPGVPDRGTREHRVFWAAAWPSFYSGLSYSVIVGVLVGLFLFYYQKEAEERQTMRGYARELSVMKQHVKAALSRPTSFNIQNAANSAPPEAQAVADVLLNSPISLWSDELADQKPFFGLVNDFQKDYDTFQNAAGKMDQALSQFARSYDADKNTIPYHDYRVYQYVFGALQNYSPQDLLRLIPFSTQLDLPSLPEAFEAAKADQSVSAAHIDYAKDRDALINQLDVLKRNLGM